MTNEMVASYARIGGFAHKYWKMAEDSYSRFLDNEEKISLLEPQEDPSDLMELESIGSTLGIYTIVFSGLCLESSVYDFAAISLSDEYVIKYLDKLDLLSKWMIVPKIVCDKEMRKEKIAYSCLVKLIKSRNMLVHAKSAPFDSSDIDIFEKMKFRDISFKDNVHNAYKTLLYMSLELDLMVTPRFNTIGSLTAERFPGPPANLIKIYKQCQNIFLKSISR